MLNVDPFEQHVAARLLDFFSSVTLWNRRLWNTGLVLTLREVLEASEAVQAGVLSDATLTYLCGTASSLMGSDPGVGPIEQKKLLQKTLSTAIRHRGIEYLKIQQVAEDIEQNYLKRWSAVLASQNRAGPERTARAIATHMLDAGLSSDYLHRWWTYRVHYEAATRSLWEIVAEAHDLVHRGPQGYDVLVAFVAAPKSKSGMPGGWLEAEAVSNWLSAQGFSVSGVRQNGGIKLRVSAHDPWSAVEQAVEIVDSFGARVAVGTRKRLETVPTVWIAGEPDPFTLTRRRRGIEVSALYREDQLYPEAREGLVNAAIELLEPLASGSSGPAVAGGWAAIEALLTSPGSENVLAGDRLASIVACSFPRAELTTLAYQLEKTGGGSVPTSLRACTSNRDRAALLAELIRNGESLSFREVSDQAAIFRMEGLLQKPHLVLRDIQNHVVATFRRLYRNRNLVLHWGRTNAVALRASLRTAAPLVGAGMDRIAHAWFNENLSPLELAARAGIRLEVVASDSSITPIDLLERL